MTTSAFFFAEEESLELISAEIPASDTFLKSLLSIVTAELTVTSCPSYADMKSGEFSLPEYDESSVVSCSA